MFDILLKQMELQHINKYTGVNSWLCKDACHLLKSANVAHWSTQHTCSNVTKCSFCESAVIWHQFCLQLLVFLAPKRLAHPPDMFYEESSNDSERKSPFEGTKKHDNKPDVVINMSISELHSVGGVLVHMPHKCTFLHSVWLRIRNLPNFMHKIIELEETDKEIIHLLIFLLMQFLSRPDQAYPSDDKLNSKTQGIVLRHFYLLLGYNQTDKSFYMISHKLRSSTVFNVFMTYLSQVLDQNYNMGLFMIQPFLNILKNAPCSSQKIIQFDNTCPTYSLWNLEMHCRRSWLISVLVILYKFYYPGNRKSFNYEYGQQPWYEILQVLIKIVLYMLDEQCHECNRVPATLIMSSRPCRSRDISQQSLGIDDEIISTNLATGFIAYFYN